MKKILTALLVGLGLISTTIMLAPPQLAYAAECAGVSTAILDCPNDTDDGAGIWWIISLVIQILTYAVGVLATVGVVWCAVTYTTAGDDPGKVATAKKRLMEIAIGLVAYALMTTMAQFLIPGGVW